MPPIGPRLDKVIARLEELRRGQPVNPMKELLADLLAKGEIPATAARRILAEYQREQSQKTGVGQGSP